MRLSVDKLLRDMTKGPCLMTTPNGYAAERLRQQSGSSRRVRRLIRYWHATYLFVGDGANSPTRAPTDAEPRAIRLSGVVFPSATRTIAPTAAINASEPKTPTATRYKTRSPCQEVASAALAAS